MAILSHGSDLSLAAAITSIVPVAGGTVDGALRQLASVHCPAVQLDATMRGVRPRELSQQARRDLAAIVARRSLRLAGVDFFIPRRHYADRAEVDRAVSSTVAAIRLAADLGRLPVSVSLPVDDLRDDVESALIEAADGHGVKLAVHAEDQLDALITWLDRVDQPVIGAGLDPAMVLGVNRNPVDVAHRLSTRLFVARLSDTAARGPSSSRCMVGQGELDVVGYRIALDLATKRVGPVIVDPRGLTAPVEAVASAMKTWSDAAFTA